MVHVPQYVARGCRHLSARRPSATFLTFSLGERLAPRIPRRLGYLLADAGGELMWLFNRSARRAVRWNLAHVLGRAPERRLVRQVFRHGARNYYDTFIIPTLSRPALLGLVRVADWGPLDRALRKRRGAIMVGGHISSVALAGQAVAAAGYPITSVAERVEPPELDDLLHRLRNAGGIRMLALGPDTMRELLAALRREEVIGLVMDRDVAGSGVEVPFFGARARLPGGAALLALRTGAPILPAVAYRGADQRFRAEILPPVPVERGASLAESIRLTTAAIARRFEGIVRAHPDQWTVYQPIWPLPGPPRARSDAR